MIGTRDGLRSYANSRGISPPEIGIDERADQALTRATDYIETFYVSRFDTRLTVPTDVLEKAAYEAAILELSKKGFFNAVYSEDDRKVLVEAKGIRWEYLGDKSKGATPKSERIEALLGPYMSGSGLALYVI